MIGESKLYKRKGEFYGTTTLGERGQVVIPARARKILGLKKGEQLLVLGMGENMIAFIKLKQVKKLTAHLTKKLQFLNYAIKNLK